MTTAEYLQAIARRYKSGLATEHSFRGDLQQLLQALLQGVEVTNEPRRQACGAPDYILTKKDVPVGYIEAKDLGDEDLLGKKKNKEQFARYKAALDNLLITDYLTFHFYREGEFIGEVRIGEIVGKEVRPLPDGFSLFEARIRDFGRYLGQTIKNPKKLAEVMAEKAQMLARILTEALNSDEANEADTALRAQLTAFQKVLIRDTTAKEFADVYAQTIVYGLFAARYHDKTPNTFSRQEAYELLPKSNPFLKKLFGYIAGYEVDDRITWVIDDLVTIFGACDVAEIMQGYGRETKQEDPVIHFYETFLTAYDKKQRKLRGVWYTPQPVVDFIVRAVDDLLKTEFKMPRGLADSTKNKDKPDMHRLQVLDPAVGTGTFLAEVVRKIYQHFQGQEGIWSAYVEDHLMPRLNGFELLMASYAMAHLKLDLLLSETGFVPKENKRLKIYLTNSLEDSPTVLESQFANWLTNEANEANRVKTDAPVMCILGNPPYNGESKNKGAWIMELMESYKHEPGTNNKLKEANSKFINDDYVKFIRLGQHFIEKNGSGILAFINPHGYLDNPTFRGMRWSLLQAFDSIYTLDLHGNAKKKETAPDGSPDENVFDIEQGVSVNIFVKTGKKNKKELARVLHTEILGKRAEKYAFLLDNSMKSLQFEEVPTFAPYYFFNPKKLDVYAEEYHAGFSLPELFIENQLGLLSKNDDITYDYDRENLRKRLHDFITLTETELRLKYAIKEDSRDWVLARAVLDVKQSIHEDHFISVAYRPFDQKWTFCSGRPKGFFAYDQHRIMKHIKGLDNIALLSGRQGQVLGDKPWSLLFVTDTVCDQNIFYRGGGNIFPLYLYKGSNGQPSLYRENRRTPNLNVETIATIAHNLCLAYTPEKEETPGTFAPIDLLDYIYGVLHSPTYREKFKAFLLIDFPRVPYPTDAVRFWRLVQLGRELRQIHLLESPVLDQLITRFPKVGTNEVEKLAYVDGKVFINTEQYFEPVPPEIWAFSVGGYEPAQKWLKDRKGRTLEVDDIFHYQKIIVALSETQRIMQEIDQVGP